MDFKIALVYKQTQQITTGHYWQRALVSLGYDLEILSPLVIKNISEDIGLLIRVDDGEYTSDEVNILKNLAKRPQTIYYAIDTHFPLSFQKNVAIAKNYDRVFCAQYNGVEQLKKAGIKADWLPLACDPEFHKKMDVSKRYAIGFVGGDHLDGSRKYILQELRERYPDSYINQAPSEQMGQIYSASKVGINLSAAGDVNMRFFEILSCGTFLLTDRIKGNGLEPLGFEEGTHYVGHSSLKELFEKIEFYLDHAELREAIAFRGHQFAVQAHTYITRMRKGFLNGGNA